jgi:hypothetical protein
MSARAPYRDPLVLFLAAVAAVLLWALWQRLAVPSFADTLVLLREGDLERSERSRLWNSLLEPGSDSPERLLAAAMAAICLGDERRYLDFAQRLGSADGPLPVEAAQLPALALGEPCVGHLLDGWLAERGKDRARAAVAYRQAEASAGMWALPLAGTLAHKGLERVR